MDLYNIAAFRSREQTIKFYENLRTHRVNCSVINTPKEASVGCGISVKYPSRYQHTAQLVLSRGKFNTFIGFFEVTEKFNRRYVQKIIW